jgi:hypothetical protein
MSVSGPTLTSHHLWVARENKCFAVLSRALMILRQLDSLGESEIDLNRQLYFCLLTASRELYADDEIAPLTECNNQPDPDDEARAKREQKRPDFQWVYLDRYESDPHRSRREFVVECKRLGKTLRLGWVFNSNYTDHGIVRFQESEWAYAKRVPSGAMVGYWQSMEADELLADVHQASRKESLPDLMSPGGWNPGAVTRFEHIFDRPFEISPFKLHHLWIDLRSSKDDSK